jgi:hypothetical protein
LVQILAILAGLALLVGVPAALIWSMVDYHRNKDRYREQRGSGSFTAGIGAAMQEIDRLFARPSVEHTVETETPVLKREDDAGDDLKPAESRPQQR